MWAPVERGNIVHSMRFAAPAALVLGFSGLASAEEGQDSAAAFTEEIIVTATYRETNLMDTAQSINALTG